MNEKTFTPKQIIEELMLQIRQYDEHHLAVMEERKLTGKFKAGTDRYRANKLLRDNARGKVLWMARLLAQSTP
jgi:hypothetical protein